MPITKPNTSSELFLPDNYLQRGKAIVAYNPLKRVWVAPGGREIPLRRHADALGWKIHDLMCEAA